MSNLDLLVHRYLEDRGSLAPRELDDLIAGLRADPELAITLRDQLLLDDLLAQKLAPDRLNFVAQVEQRIADLERGHDELSKPLADLRSLAAAEKRSTWQQMARHWMPFVLGICAVALLSFVALYATRSTTPHSHSIAKIASVVGDVKIMPKDGDTFAAEADGSVEPGQQITVPPGGMIVLSYEDGTELRIKGDTIVKIGDQQPTAAKRVRIDKGEVIVSVKLQPAGAMRFITPHATATAQSSILRLLVTDDKTLLDVSEGRVQFDRLADKQTLLIAANESGTASRDTFQNRQLMWPDRRDGLAYLFSPLEKAAPDLDKPLTLARHPETRDLRFSPMEPRGDAILQESRWFYELNGGYFIAPEAGRDIFASNRTSSELTLEAVFSPASLNQAGPARIIALGAEDSDEQDFALDQDGSDVMFCLKTDAKPATASPQRLAINSADAPLHLVVTYRHGELIIYRDGIEIARSNDLWGSLAAWRSGPLTVGADASGEHSWRGILEAFALYNRCLEPGEVARNARNYRLLAGRGM